MKERTGATAQVTDRSDEFAQIAVQGPKAATLVQRLTKVELSPVKNYHFAAGTVGPVEYQRQVDELPVLPQREISLHQRNVALLRPALGKGDAEGALSLCATRETHQS